MAAYSEHTIRQLLAEQSIEHEGIPDDVTHLPGMKGRRTEALRPLAEVDPEFIDDRAVVAVSGIARCYHQAQHGPGMFKES